MAAALAAAPAGPAASPAAAAGDQPCPAGTGIGHLPDDILRLIFGMIPSELEPFNLRFRLRDSRAVFAVSSRPVEWVEAALDSGLVAFRRRRVQGLSLVGCTRVLTPALPRRLALPLFSQLHSLELGGSSMLLFTPFLALCDSMRRLQLTLSAEVASPAALALLCEHLCELPAPLERLTLLLPGPVPAAAVKALFDCPQKREMALLNAPMPCCLWGPRLRRAQLALPSLRHARQLSAALPQLPQLRALRLVVALSGRQGLSMPGLLGLPQLQRLDCCGSLPVEAWRCSALTCLKCTSALLDLPGGRVPPGAAPALRSLGLVHCRFAGGAFPAELCCALPQLTALRIMEPRGRLLSASSDGRRHQQLRHLDIYDCQLSRAGLDRLPASLTSLMLARCGLTWLPDGPYLRRLRCLDISHNRFSQPLPFQATAASRLEGLETDCLGPWAAGCCLHRGDWEDLKAKLDGFPRLNSRSSAARLRLGEEGETVSSYAHELELDGGDDDDDEDEEEEEEA
ncbi:hypothetical protein ABPG75_004894 [Micractinium tetrahymenae]